ncbi:MAG: DUF3098 domain-containing protein [Ginsengibacter sp.]
MKSQSANKVTSQEKVISPKHSSTDSILFTRENYKWMVIGLVVMAIGFFLLSGGKSSDPTVFKDSEIYSPMRITVAPILIVAGLVIEIFAIMKKPK